MLDNDDDVALRAAVVDGVDVDPLLVVPAEDAGAELVLVRRERQHHRAAVLPDELTVDDLGPRKSVIVVQSPVQRRVAAGAQPDRVARPVATASRWSASARGCANRSLNSTSVDRAADAVTYTVAVGAGGQLDRVAVDGRDRAAVREVASEHSRTDVP